MLGLLVNYRVSSDMVLTEDNWVCREDCEVRVQFLALCQLSIIERAMRSIHIRNVARRP